MEFRLLTRRNVMEALLLTRRNVIHPLATPVVLHTKDVSEGNDMTYLPLYMAPLL